MGESPGSRYMRSSRRYQGPVCQAGPASGASARAPAAAGHSRPARPASARTRGAGGALHLVVQARLEGVDVDRQPALAPQVVEDVLVGGMDVLVGDAQPRRQLADEALGILRRVVRGRAFVGEQRGLRQQGWPSARQQIDSAQRGSCSPGYHLPWPKCRKPPSPYWRAACAPVRRHSRAWWARAHRCSIRRRRGRRRRRRSARRPW